MPRLILKMRAEVIKEMSFTEEKAELMIGSNSINDFVIDDKKVSAEHACIVRKNGRFFIKDLKSAFGIFVNQKKIYAEKQLQNGDQVYLGSHTIVFDDPNGLIEEIPEQQNSNVQTSEYVLIDETSTSIVSLNNLDSTSKNSEVPEFSQMAPYYLLAIYGPYTGKKYQLKYGTTRIGRDIKLNDIIIREDKKKQIDSSISRRHASISHKDDAFFIGDKRSKTRTFVNRIVVPENEEIELRANDEIEIVSDRQSTIFRLVAEGNWDFSPVQKAGVWSIRHRKKFTTAAAAFCMLAGLFLLNSGWSTRSVAVQKPDPFEMEMLSWGVENKRSQMPGQDFQAVQDDQSGPAVDDFNGDGHVDILSMDLGQNLRLIDGKSKRVLWRLTSYSIDPDYSIVVADLNKDKLPDALFVSRSGEVVAVDGKFGAEIWKSPFLQTPFSGPPVIGDFNGDGQVDFAIIEQTGKLHVGLSEYIEMKWHMLDLGVSIKSPPVSADLDFDGKTEVICGSERGIVFIVDGELPSIVGTIDINDELAKARGTQFEENQIRHPVGVADLNNDGNLDLFVSSIQGNLIAVDGRNRHRLWDAAASADTIFVDEFTNPFAFGDLNNDEAIDVVVAAPNGKIIAYSGAGLQKNAHTLWEVSIGPDKAVGESIIVVDVNKDRAADTVLLDAAGKLHVLDGNNGQTLWKSSQPGVEQTSKPFVADLGDDGLLDVVLVASSGKIYQYKSNSLIPHGAVLWGQYYGHGNHQQKQSFTLPGTMGATFSLLFGAILFVGTTVLSIGLKLRRQRLG